MRNRRTAIGILLVWLVGVLASACATGPSPTPNQSPTGKTEATAKPSAATPAAPSGQAQPGTKQPPTDSLVVLLPTLEAETFLPWNGGGGRSPYLGMIYEYLLYIDPKTEEPKPGLAVKWEMSDDAKIWTFHLRSGVQFQEGQGELTSADVKYSLERLIAPESKAGPASQLRALIDKIETPAADTVVIYLKNPYPELDRGLLSDGNQALIVSKKYVESAGEEKANAHPIGSGAFALAEEHKKGGPIKLQAVAGSEKHWRVQPEFKTVTFLGVPEEATRVAMLKTGEADLAPISYDSIETVKGSGLHIVSLQKNWSPVIRLGGLISTDAKRYNAEAPWAKQVVRQALNYAVDKEAIARTIFKGEATPAGASLPLSPWMNLTPYPYDVAKARALLAQAGYPNGFPITLKTFTTTPGAELPIVGEAVALYWKAIGLDVKIVPTDWGTVRGEWTGGKANTFTWTHRGFAFTDMLTGPSTEFATEQLFASFASPETTASLEKAGREMDPKKRSEIIHDLGQYARDEAVDVFLVYANEPYGASKKVGQWPSLRVRPQNIDMITHP